MSKNIKVVKVIDEYEVVINAGENAGVAVGDIYEIYAPGEPVFDIDSNEILGTLDYIKARIKVKQVFEKMSICINANSGTITTVALANMFGALNGPLPLNVDSLEISGGFEDAEKKIQVGDLVRKSL